MRPVIFREAQYNQAALADRHQDDGDWQSVLQRSRESSHAMHDIAAALRSSGQSTSESLDLTSLVDRQRQELSEAGFRGMARVSCDAKQSASHAESVYLDGDLGEEMRLLLLELAANIRKYADSSELYRLYIRVEPMSVEVSQSNRVREQVAAYNAAKNSSKNMDNGNEHSVSGIGMSGHIARIRDLGGEVSCSCDDDLWVFYARIPRVRRL